MLDLPPRPFSWRRVLKHMMTSLFRKQNGGKPEAEPRLLDTKR